MQGGGVGPVVEAEAEVGGHVQGLDCTVEVAGGTLVAKAKVGVWTEGGGEREEGLLDGVYLGGEGGGEERGGGFFFGRIVKLKSHWFYFLINIIGYLGLKSYFK